MGVFQAIFAELSVCDSRARVLWGVRGYHFVADVPSDQRIQKCLNECN